MKTSFEISETIGIGIINPGQVIKISGSPENLERFLAFAIQSGLEVQGLTEEEMQKYIKFELDI